MKFKYLIILSVLALISSCGSKKVSVDERPSWVKSRPLSDADYIGIGKASKIKSPNKYLQLAKNDALSDISSEVSVKISSSSVLSSVETPQGFADTYSSLIKSNTKNDLEGYILVSTFETETDYWCYYQLNKQKYSLYISEKRNTAISKSLDLYQRSIDSRKNGKLKYSILFNIKAIEAVKDYWSEKIEIDFNGKSILLGNELMANLNKIIGEITVIPDVKNIDGVRGKSITNDLLSFTLSDSERNFQEGIPVLFIYSDGRISKNKVVSDRFGKVSYGFKKLKSRNNNVKFVCRVDLSNLIDEASSDYMLHKLLDNMTTPKASVNISVRNPIIYINSNEKVLGEKYVDNEIRNVMNTYLINKEFKTTKIKKESDFELRIDADTKKVSRNSDRVYTCELSVDIKMYADGEVVYSTRVNDVLGRGSSYKGASIDAYGKIGNDIEVKVGNQIYRYISD